MKKPSKYKKLDTWVESSGELSSDEIALVFICDKIDSEIDLTDDEREFLLSLKCKKVDKSRIQF